MLIVFWWCVVGCVLCRRWPSLIYTNEMSRSAKIFNGRDYVRQKVFSFSFSFLLLLLFSCCRRFRFQFLVFVFVVVLILALILVLTHVLIIVVQLSSLSLSSSSSSSSSSLFCCCCCRRNHHLHSTSGWSSAFRSGVIHMENETRNGRSGSGWVSSNSHRAGLLPL